MISNISFGRYLPYNSIIHRLDPRFKLLALILIISSIFITTGFTGYMVLAVVILTLFFLSKLKFNLLWRLFKHILFIFIILIIFNFFFIVKPVSYDPDGWKSVGYIFWTPKFKIMVISWKGILSALYIGSRIYLMILVTAILTSTTKPLDLTLALEDLLMPLKLIRIPVHIISLIISIALRLIPTLIEEALRIMKAQASRGVDFKNGHFKEKIKSIVSLIIPLIVSAFQKAEDLGDAMGARGYDPEGRRTRFRQYKIRIIDVIFLLLTALILTFIIILSKDLGVNFLNNWDFWKPIRYIDQFVWYKIKY